MTFFYGKVVKWWYKVNHSRLEDIINVIITTFELMLENGMVSYTNHRYKKVIEYEMCVFTNMLELVHLWESNILKFKTPISGYLIYNTRNKLNLKNLYLKDAILERVDLQEADLRNADLRRVDLQRALLINADLRNADLRNADLRGADVSGVNLEGANLAETIFDENQVPFLKKKYDLNKSKIYVYDENSKLGYYEFLIMKESVQKSQSAKKNQGGRTGFSVQI